MFDRIVAISLMNLQNVPHRLGSSSLIVVGTAGIVCVLCGLFAMSSGLEGVTRVGGANERVLMLSKGTPHEFGSYIPAEIADLLNQLDGFMVRSKERLIAIRQKNQERGRDDYILVRGLGQDWKELRSEVEVVQGRTFSPGRAEAIVGRALLHEFPEYGIGRTIPFYQGDLSVVGVFEANGNLSESEAFTDLSIVADRYGGNFTHTVRGQLTSPRDFDSVAAQLDRITQGYLRLVWEASVLPEHVKERTTMIENFATVVITIMALGAVTASLASMTGSVESRTREIATLRALGFGNGPVAVSILVEACVLSALGAAIGVTLVFASLDGVEAATRGGLGNTLLFRFDVDAMTIARCALLAMFLAFCGAAAATMRVVRLPVVQSLS